MMRAAERHGEFVTDFAPEGTWLREAKMVSVGRLTAADHAFLLRNEFQVLFVADTARLREGEGALVDL